MESLVIRVSLVYSLVVCSFVLIALFRDRGKRTYYPLITIGATCLHAIYKLIWLALADGNQFEVPIPLGLVYPVILYLFARAYYLPERTISAKRMYRLFSPFIIYVVLFTATLFQPLQSGWIKVYSSLYFVSCILWLLIFATATAKLSAGYKGPSAPADTLIRQLTMLCYGLVVLAYVVWYETSAAESPIGFEVRPAVYLFMILGCALIARYQFAHRVYLLSRDRHFEPHMLVGAPIARERSVELAEIIESELHRSKLFLNPDISLDMLARQTALPRHQLTRIFNEHYGKSFYQFIAGMRIEYATSLILNVQDALTLDSLSYACGFNSKTSFNRYFKVYTGVTPSAYRSVHLSVRSQSITVSK